MIAFQNRISAFIELGKRLQKLPSHSIQNTNGSLKKLLELLPNLKHRNGWFTEKEVNKSLAAWGNLLSEDSLKQWVTPYKMDIISPKTVGIVMAGNIPLVGFHDLVCVLLTGHRALIKLSSNDALLIPVICDLLIEIEPMFADYIEFADSKLENFDAAIATGSNNSARYFHHYFDKYPNIIRSNRNSVAVLTGEETQEELAALGSDIFDYYGLGCRSVSKLYVPKNYNFDAFFNAIYPKSNIIDHSKYANNYDYNKAVYLMSEFNILDNGFLILKEAEELCSPLATVFYEYYTDLENIQTTLEQKKEAIQCVVSNHKSLNGIPFGTAQSPKLNDYADRVDTVQFLLKIS